MTKNAPSSTTREWDKKLMPINWEMNSKDISSRSPEEMTNKVSPWDKVSSSREESEFWWERDRKVTDLEEPENRKENRSEAALLDLISEFSASQSSRRETRIWKVKVLIIHYELGVTTVNIARRLGPKRLSKLRRLFGVKKTVGVALIKKNIIRRTWTNKDGKKR